MNYQKIYDQIINNARASKKRAGEYYEGHHVIPRSMGGSDDKSNIVLLTARQHYLAHWLLYKIHRNAAMATAWYFMRTHSTGKRYVSSSFKYAKKAHIKHLTGRKLSDEHKEKIRMAGIGRKGTEKQSKAAAKANRSREWSKESRQKASIAKKGKFLGGNHPRSKRVINVTTGEIFDCMTDAAQSLGVTVAAVQNQITRDGLCKGNKFRYFDALQEND